MGKKKAHKVDRLDEVQVPVEMHEHAAFTLNYSLKAWNKARVELFDVFFLKLAHNVLAQMRDQHYVVINFYQF